MHTKCLDDLLAQASCQVLQSMNGALVWLLSTAKQGMGNLPAQATGNNLWVIYLASKSVQDFLHLLLVHMSLQDSPRIIVHHGGPTSHESTGKISILEQ
jgi:hypothetical protein